MRLKLLSAPPGPSRRAGAPSRGDALFVLAVLLAYAANALWLEPDYEQRPAIELLYGCALSVGTGALIGFVLFDRYGFRRVGQFLGATVALIAVAALINEAIVEPNLFGDGPLNGEGLYYSVTDIVGGALIFFVLRLLQLLSRHLAATAAPAAGPGETGWLFVRIANQTHRILASDLLYMKAERDFTHVVCGSGTWFVSESLKDLLARASTFGMVRVHKSFAVNLRRVDRLTGSGVEVGGLNVPVGRTFRAKLAADWMGEAAETPRPAVACG